MNQKSSKDSKRKKQGRRRISEDQFPHPFSIEEERLQYALGLSLSEQQLKVDEEIRLLEEQHRRPHPSSPPLAPPRLPPVPGGETTLWDRARGRETETKNGGMDKEISLQNDTGGASVKQANDSLLDTKSNSKLLGNDQRTILETIECQLNSSKNSEDVLEIENGKGSSGNEQQFSNIQQVYDTLSSQYHSTQGLLDGINTILKINDYENGNEITAGHESIQQKSDEGKLNIHNDSKNNFDDISASKFQDTADENMAQDLSKRQNDVDTLQCPSLCEIESKSQHTQSDATEKSFKHDSKDLSRLITNQEKENFVSLLFSLLNDTDIYVNDADKRFHYLSKDKTDTKNQHTNMLPKVKTVRRDTSPHSHCHCECAKSVTEHDELHYSYQDDPLLFLSEFDLSVQKIEQYIAIGIPLSVIQAQLAEKERKAKFRMEQEIEKYNKVHDQIDLLKSYIAERDINESNSSKRPEIHANRKQKDASISGNSFSRIITSDDTVGDPENAYETFEKFSRKIKQADSSDCSGHSKRSKASSFINCSTEEHDEPLISHSSLATKNEQRLNDDNKLEEILSQRCISEKEHPIKEHKLSEESHLLIGMATKRKGENVDLVNTCKKQKMINSTATGTTQKKCVQTVSVERRKSDQERNSCCPKNSKSHSSIDAAASDGDVSDVLKSDIEIIIDSESDDTDAVPSKLHESIIHKENFFSDQHKNSKVSTAIVKSKENSEENVCKYLERHENKNKDGNDIKSNETSFSKSSIIIDEFQDKTFTHLENITAKSRESSKSNLGSSLSQKKELCSDISLLDEKASNYDLKTSLTLAKPQSEILETSPDFAHPESNDVGFLEESPHYPHHIENNTESVSNSKSIINTLSCSSHNNKHNTLSDKVLLLSDEETDQNMQKRLSQKATNDHQDETSCILLSDSEPDDMLKLSSNASQLCIADDTMPLAASVYVNNAAQNSEQTTGLHTKSQSEKILTALHDAHIEPSSHFLFHEANDINTLGNLDKKSISHNNSDVNTHLAITQNFEKLSHDKSATTEISEHAVVPSFSACRSAKQQVQSTDADQKVASSSSGSFLMALPSTQRSRQSSSFSPVLQTSNFNGDGLMIHAFDDHLSPRNDTSSVHSLNVQDVRSPSASPLHLGDGFSSKDTGSVNDLVISHENSHNSHSHHPLTFFSSNQPLERAVPRSQYQNHELTQKQKACVVSSSQPPAKSSESKTTSSQHPSSHTKQQQQRKESVNGVSQCNGWGPGERMPDWSSLPPESLSSLLAGYGVRQLPQDKAIAMLARLWMAQHPPPGVDGDGNELPEEVRMSLVLRQLFLEQTLVQPPDVAEIAKLVGGRKAAEVYLENQGFILDKENIGRK